MIFQRHFAQDGHIVASVTVVLQLQYDIHIWYFDIWRPLLKKYFRDLILLKTQQQSLERQFHADSRGRTVTVAPKKTATFYLLAVETFAVYRMSVSLSDEFRFYWVHDGVNVQSQSSGIVKWHLSYLTAFMTRPLTLLFRIDDLHTSTTCDKQVSLQHLCIST